MLGRKLLLNLRSFSHFNAVLAILLPYFPPILNSINVFFFQYFRSDSRASRSHGITGIVIGRWRSAGHAQ